MSGADSAGLSPDDLDAVAELLGPEIAREDAPAVAASIANLRAGLREFRQTASALLEEAADD